MLKLLIASKKHDGRKNIEVCNPFNESVVQQLAVASDEQLQLAMSTAAQALHDDFPVYRRIDFLESWQKHIELNRDRFVEMLITESGKPRVLAEIEFERSIETLKAGRLACVEIEGHFELPTPAASAQGQIAFSQYLPKGIVAAITPFNFPMNLALHKIVPALAAGCPVILKPSPKSPSVAYLLAECAYEAGIPPQMLSVLMLDNEQIAPWVADHRLAVLSFTGSAQIGWQLKQQVTRAEVMLELGGNAANIIFDDADYEMACHVIAQGAFSFAGQSCISPQRVLIHERAYEQCQRLFVEEAQKIECGDPHLEKNLVGPVIDSQARNRILSTFQSAQAAGAKIMHGGYNVHNVITPTVIEDCPMMHPLIQEELFGPGIALIRFQDESSAFAQANASRFGLQTAVFTKDIDRAFRSWNSLQVGGVMINQSSAHRVDAWPYGGEKDSGTGKEGPRQAIHHYMKRRLLMIKRSL